MSTTVSAKPLAPTGDPGQPVQAGPRRCCLRTSPAPAGTGMSQPSKSPCTAAAYDFRQCPPYHPRTYGKIGTLPPKPSRNGSPTSPPPTPWRRLRAQLDIFRTYSDAVRPHRAHWPTKLHTRPTSPNPKPPRPAPHCTPAPTTSATTASTATANSPSAQQPPTPRRNGSPLRRHQRLDPRSTTYTSPHRHHRRRTTPRALPQTPPRGTQPQTRTVNNVQKTHVHDVPRHGSGVRGGT